MKIKDTWVIIPVYNEKEVIENVLRDVLRYFENVVCVDDASLDGSADLIKKTKARLVQHIFNLGQGAALQTGIDFALRDKRAKYFVTFDADGQHLISDVINMRNFLIKEKKDVALGSRFIKKNKIPFLRRIVLKTAVLFSKIVLGSNLTDAHNGLRVFNRKFAEIIDIRLRGMAHSSEIPSRFRSGKFRYAEFPVTIKYTEYSKRRGQSAINMINIIFDLFIDSLRRR